MSARDPRVGKLIDRLRDDLRVRFADDAAELVLLSAASELWLEHDEAFDAEALRLTTARIVLQVLGVSDASIEATKMQLAQWRDLNSLNWRN